MRFFASAFQSREIRIGKRFSTHLPSLPFSPAPEFDCLDQSLSGAVAPKVLSPSAAGRFHLDYSSDSTALYAPTIARLRALPSTSRPASRSSASHAVRSVNCQRQSTDCHFRGFTCRKLLRTLLTCQTRFAFLTLSDTPPLIACSSASVIHIPAAN
jgi:hypothetical protein